MTTAEVSFDLASIHAESCEAPIATAARCPTSPPYAAGETADRRPSLSFNLLVSPATAASGCSPDDGEMSRSTSDNDDDDDETNNNNDNKQHTPIMLPDAHEDIAPWPPLSGFSDDATSASTFQPPSASIAFNLPPHASAAASPNDATTLLAPPLLTTVATSLAASPADGAIVPPACTRSNLTPIVPGTLYLGSCRDVNDAAACAALGIGAYLCVAKEIALPAHAAGAPALHLPLVDGAEESLAAHVPAAVAFIDAQAAAGRRVALFCQAGRSRSVSLAVAYVMRSTGADSAAALDAVAARYPRADPNLWFLQQLAEL